MDGARTRAGLSPARSVPARPQGRTRSLLPGEVAWIAAIPCALVLIGAILALGPLVGDAFLQPGKEAFWPVLGVKPQPAEHGRFLVGLLGPVVLALLVLASGHERVRARLRLRAPAARGLVVASQTLLVGFVALCFASQNNILLSGDYALEAHVSYFNWRTLLVAAALPALALGLLRRERTRAQLTAILRETPLRRRALAAAAALLTTAWMLTAVNADSSIGNTIEAVSGHLLWTMSETFAVLDGRTPLVDYHAQYGQLWAYLTAGPMAVFGATILLYTGIMATASGLAMLGVYAVLRRVTGSSAAALAIYAPFIATSFFTIVGPLPDRYGPANLYPLWPIRFAGPWLLLWLAARHVDGAAPRRAWVLFVAGGFVAVNNPDFGLASIAATLAAIASATPPRSWRTAGRLLGSAALGLAIAVATFTLFTLVRSGSLPDFTLLSEFSKLYGIGGWAQQPMPAMGLYLAVFLTFGVAIAVAVVRAMTRRDERLLTAMLAWIGVFGLIATVYFGGRAHPRALFDFFAPWALALALLLVVVVRELAARGWRGPTAPELVVLFAFGLVVCSLPQTPAPWTQLARIGDASALPLFKQQAATRFVDALTDPGEPVELLMPLGFRIAYDLHLRDVSPYSSIESMPTRQQLDLAVAALRRAHGRKLFLNGRFMFDEELAAFEQRGFAVVQSGQEERGGQISELVDRGTTSP